MRITAFFLFVCCLHVSAGVFSQSVTFSGRDIPLTKIFNTIEQQTGFVVFYNQGVLSGSKPVTVDVKDMPLEEFLQLVFKHQSLKYRIDGKDVILSKDITHLLPVKNVFPVTGQVLDMQGKPLSGATIKVKGAKRGVLTDAQGRFTIDAKQNDELSVSFVGFEELTIVVEGENNITAPATKQRGSITTSLGGLTIHLHPAETSLNEVTVNAGYYKVQGDKLTGNIAKVTSKDIERQPVTSPLMALQGRVAGLEITPGSGTPGQAIKIRVRGDNSVRMDGNYPLYVIDGIPVNSTEFYTASSSLVRGGYDPISSLNPANIESIEVLKDADATSIYGSRGANGVILITTKKPQAGKTGGDVSIYHGIGKVPQKLDLLNRQSYLQMRREAFANTGETPGIYNARDMMFWDTTRYTDWQDVLLGGTSNITDIQGNLSGGNQYTTFRLGGSYHKETMVFPGTFGYRRASGNFTLHHNSADQRLRVTLALNYGHEKNRLFDDANLVDMVYSLTPVAPAIYDAAGNLNWQSYDDGGSSWQNPFALFRKTQDMTGSAFLANNTLSYEISPRITARLSAGYTDQQTDESRKIPISSMDPADVYSGTTAENIFTNNKRHSWILEPQLDYQLPAGDHLLQLTVGGTWQYRTDMSQQILARGYSSDALLGSLEGAESRYIPRDENDHYKYAAVFARAGYSFRDKYLLNFTARRDGSSRFGPGNRYGNFASAAAAWIFSGENFFNHHLHFLSFGKLRGSYGSSGNDQIGDYEYLNTYGKALSSYEGLMSLVPSALFNPSYAWEQTRKLEVALETRFLKDRLSFSLSWYRNRSSNQLVRYQLPATTGFPDLLTNFGALVENRGWEILLSSRNFESADFSWTTALNLSFPRNKLVAFDGIENSSYAATYKVGMPLSVNRVYHYTGIDPQTGMYTFEDYSKDGQITDADKRFADFGTRRYYGGIDNTFRHRAWSFSFLVQAGESISNAFLSYSPGIMRNQQSSVLLRWQKPGDITNIPAFSSAFWNPNANNANVSDYALRPVAFVRLKTLSLAYRFPETWLRQVGMKQGTLFLQGQNIFTITKFDGPDPETGYSLPPLRMVTFGIQFNL